MIFIARRCKLTAIPNQFAASYPLQDIRPALEVSPIEDMIVSASAGVAFCGKTDHTSCITSYKTARFLARGGAVSLVEQGQLRYVAAYGARSGSADALFCTPRCSDALFCTLRHSFAQSCTYVSFRSGRASRRPIKKPDTVTLTVTSCGDRRML
jgi:hypothetical protein